MTKLTKEQRIAFITQGREKKLAQFAKDRQKIAAKWSKTTANDGFIEQNLEEVDEDEEEDE